MKKKTIGIVLEFGFHDLKKYIYSGLGQKIGAHFDIVWLAIQKNSEEFHRLFSETGFPIIYFDNEDFISSSITEGRNIAVRRAWMNKKKLGQFHNYRSLQIGRVKTRILGNNLLKNYFEKRTLRVVETRYVNREIEQILKSKKLDLIFTAGYSSSFAKSVIVTAFKNGLPSFLLINNWKDLYINNFIPFTFLSTIFVWDEGMKSDLLYHMTYLDPSKIIVSGNPVFDSLKKSSPEYDRQFYSGKYNISPNADWLYYTMMSPLSGINEIEVVKCIGKEMAKEYNKEEKVILLRRNPQHSRNDFIHAELPENVVLTDHYSYFDRIKDMHTQSPEGEQEWIDLLHHCALNLSVPSTVTLEFLTLGKPVINIGFGPEGKPDQRLKQHFEAGFYKPLFKDERVKKAERLGDLITALNDCKKIIPKAENTTSQQSATDIIIQRLLEDVNK